jgi:hypothetical protein
MIHDDTIDSTGSDEQDLEGPLPELTPLEQLAEVQGDQGHVRRVFEKSDVAGKISLPPEPCNKSGQRWPADDGHGGA